MQDWRSYDAIAHAYAQVRARQHALLASDLVDAVAPPFAGRVLDVGSGAGTAAAAAVAAMGADGHAVALDPSVALLRLGERGPHLIPVAGLAPGLPFPAERFDAVVANLVVTHFTDYEVALADIARVLRPGGRVAVSAWGAADDSPPVDDRYERLAFAAWTDVATELVDLDTLEEASDAATPWDGLFSDPANLRLALGQAGLRRIEIRSRAYKYPLTIDEWITARDTGSRGRYLRSVVGDDAWSAFRETVRGRLERAVPDPIPCVDEALIAVGSKPS